MRQFSGLSLRQAIPATCLVFMILFLLYNSLPALSRDPRVGADLIGTEAPEFAADLKWLNSKPITIASLRGKLVFVRFWMADCPMCRATIPTLRYLKSAFGDRGLVVLAIEYNSDLESDQVKRITEQESMNFPVAIDKQRKTAKAFWWNRDRSDPRTRRGWWAPSFLIDRKGQIRWVHEGGALLLSTGQGAESENPAFDDLVRALDQLLARKASERKYKQ